MKTRVAALLGALSLLVAASASTPSVAADGGSSNTSQEFATQCDPEHQPCLQLESAIAFVSTRDNPTLTPPINAAEIYLMNPDGTNPRRVTENAAGDGFPVLSPDGKKIVFDSNRNAVVGEPFNGEMFVMETDGSEQTSLLRGGGSASWSPDSKNIVFHRSASGTGVFVKPDPGAATTDSDIFVVNIDDLLAGVEQPKNLTNNGAAAVDDDPDWVSRWATDRVHQPRSRRRAKSQISRALPDQRGWNGAAGAPDQQPRRGALPRLVAGRDAPRFQLQDRRRRPRALRDERKWDRSDAANRQHGARAVTLVVTRRREDRLPEANRRPTADLVDQSRRYRPDAADQHRRSQPVSELGQA
jgi:WD40-like Beta Propeller Repeat